MREIFAYTIGPLCTHHTAASAVAIFTSLTYVCVDKVRAKKNSKPQLIGSTNYTTRVARAYLFSNRHQRPDKSCNQVMQKYISHTYTHITRH